ncbi:MAG: AAT family amino acid transporter [Lasallia pustulata]|uniref:AAT family amino acid transporter n=1 Tax=Lasallia pustulata TaxID=136370 RepID=A0A5M8PHA0_9LECA|nr:MAG: AAT family amino acid transporter [Lasallia pustulata]
MGSSWHSQGRQNSETFDEYELGTSRRNLRQNSGLLPQDGARPRTNQSHSAANGSLGTLTAPQSSVEISNTGVTGPTNDPTTRGQGLDRYLKRHHITGIAFSGILGVGILVDSGQIIGLAGGLGAILSFIIAAIVVTSVMVSMAEMVSVYPYWGLALYPHHFVGPSLGNTVGVVYWFAQATSLATLIVTGALICAGDPEQPHKVAAYSAVPLVVIPLVNAFSGIRLYGNFEWIIKWLKIIFLLGLDITVIVLIRRHGVNSLGISSTFNPTRTPKNATDNFMISGPGSLGSFLSIWTSITLAVFAFVGVEIVVVTTIEAEAPVRDLPRASRRVCIWTSLLYVVTILIVSLNVSSVDTGLQPLLGSTGFSPFIIAIKNAKLSHGSKMIKAVNAGLILAAWTTANTDLYAASRTLFELCHYSDIPWVENHLGKANSGGTPLWAIGFTYAPSLLALLSLIPGDGRLVISIFSTMTTISVLCVYAAECYAFICFKLRIKENFIDRDGDEYRRNYFRVPRQPFIAWFGLVSCTLLIFFNGWYIFWEIHNRHIKAGEAAARLIGAYGGVLIFVMVFLMNKFTLKPAKKRFNFPMGSREHDEEIRPGTRRYKTMARRCYDFVK